MNYDVELIDHWDAPEEDGVPLLCCPNIPLPLHNLCPRIVDPKRWEKMRKQCYADAKYTCQATGVELGKGHLHSHELYSVNWANHTMTFKRAVALDPRLHTRFIHSGRALTMFERDDKYFPKEALLDTLEYGFSLIDNWNIEHPDAEPLRVSTTFLDWVKNPELKDSANALIKKYHIKLYDFDKACFNKKNWGKWKLIWEGKEYPTNFATQKDWEEYFNPKPKEEIPLPNELSVLDNILKEEEENAKERTES